jgi:hypothetical protein
VVLPARPVFLGLFYFEKKCTGVSRTSFGTRKSPDFLCGKILIRITAVMQFAYILHCWLEFGVSVLVKIGEAVAG